MGIIIFNIHFGSFLKEVNNQLPFAKYFLNILSLMLYLIFNKIYQNDVLSTNWQITPVNQKFITRIKNSIKN